MIFWGVFSTKRKQPQYWYRSYLYNVTKDNMLPVQMRCVATRNKKLTTVGARARIGHGKLTCFGVLNNKIFVGKFFSVNTFAAGSVAIGEITTLNHKVLDDYNTSRWFQNKKSKNNNFRELKVR